MAERSKLGQLIKALPRKSHDFAVERMFAMGDEVQKIAIRVPRKREQDAALDSARKYVAKMLEKGEKPEDAPEFFEDAKAAAIVAVCCLDPEQDMLPVWPTLDVVTEDLTPDQIGVLVRLINEVRAKDGPTPDLLDDERVEAFATMAGLAASTDTPDSLLTPLPHPYLVHLYILTAIKLAAARAELDAVRAPAEVSEVTP
jgi:hypothetical protein